MTNTKKLLIRDSQPELYVGLEAKFWLWMSKQGAYSNLQIELKVYGLKYDDMVESMVWSYVNDHYKSAYFKPFTAFLLFEQTNPSMYGTKYWETIERLWKSYAKGEIST